MSTQYIHYPASSGGVATYGTAANLPATASDGALAVTLDTDTLYVYNLATTSWLAIGSGSTVLAVGSFDSQSPSANALFITGNTLYAQSASATVPGMVNLTTQTFTGQKTFATGLTGTLTGHATLDVATASLGNLTDVGTDGIVITGGTSAVIGNVTLAQTKADSTHNGYLSNADWSTFNGKQSALTTGNLTDVGTDGIVITGGTGAVIGSGTTLAQTKADSTHNGYLSNADWSTFNGKGTVSSVAVSAPAFLSVAGSPITGSGTIALTLSGTALPVLNGGTGTTTSTGSGSVVLSTSPALVTPALGTPSSGVLTSCTGLPLTTGVTGILPLANGGTGGATASAAFNALWPATTTGDTIYSSAGTTASRLAIGNTGQVLTVSGGLPAWANAVNVNVTSNEGQFNLGLAATVASNALTVNLKQADGSSAPSSASSAVTVAFRNTPSGAAASYTLVSATAAVSVVIPSGATLGTISAMNQYLWLYAINNAGTLELAVSGGEPFDDYSIASTTTISSGATSSSLMYSTTGRTNVAIRLIGRLLVNETTAGTWASAPTDVSLVSGKQPVTSNAFGAITWTPTITGSTTNPGLGTIAANTVTARRVGSVMQGMWYFHQTAAGTAGSGLYSMSLGSGYTINSSQLPVSNDYVMVGEAFLYNNSNRSNGYVGAQPQNNNTSLSLTGYTYNGGEGDWGSTYFPLSNTVIFQRATFQIPILGWFEHGA